MAGIVINNDFNLAISIILIFIIVALMTWIRKLMNDIKTRDAVIKFQRIIMEAQATAIHAINMEEGKVN